MGRFLLDTHVFLWLIQRDPHRLFLSDLLELIKITIPLM